jgi:hypothetical protein
MSQAESLQTLATQDRRGVIMRVLVYKRTHNGDPNRDGCFGAEDCMGKIRARDFEAVIGVGGIGPEARANGIAGQVNWIGINPHKTTKRRSRGAKRRYRGPLVTFDHFHDFRTDAPDFRTLAPALAERMYSNNIRHLMDGLRDDEYREALEILKLAENAPPSKALGAGAGKVGRTSQCVARPQNKRHKGRTGC